MAYRYNHILIRYGELSLKGKNRNNFIKALYDNVRKALKAFPTLEFANKTSGTQSTAVKNSTTVCIFIFMMKILNRLVIF